jgi:hypothetical protein
VSSSLKLWKRVSDARTLQSLAKPAFPASAAPKNFRHQIYSRSWQGAGQPTIKLSSASAIYVVYFHIMHRTLSFPFRGRSVLYFVVRPNFFDRLLRYRIAGHYPQTPGILPIVHLELFTLMTLLNAGFSPQIEKDNRYNCLHVLASSGEPLLVEALLETGRYWRGFWH